MKAKKIYEFKQGESGYKSMDIGHQDFYGVLTLTEDNEITIYFEIDYNKAESIYHNDDDETILFKIKKGAGHLYTDGRMDPSGIGNIEILKNKDRLD